MENLMKASEIAQKLNISRPYAYLLLSQGKIPSVRFGRIVRAREEDIISFIQNHLTGPTEGKTEQTSNLET